MLTIGLESVDLDPIQDSRKQTCLEIYLWFANINLEVKDKMVNLTVSPIHVAIKFEKAVNGMAQKMPTSLMDPLSTSCS